MIAHFSGPRERTLYSLSKWFNGSNGFNKIPIGSITKKPSAELSKNQYDPFDYDIVSPIVDLIINDMKNKNELIEMGYDSSIVNDILNKIHRSEYKRRQSAPGIKVSSKAFGAGRRFPIINQYKDS